jgi:hypothetical protein
MYIEHRHLSPPPEAINETTQIHHPSRRRDPATRILDRLNGPHMSNNIIQNGLAFDRQQSGTVANSWRQGRSEILPRRPCGRDGASVVRRDAAINRTEDLNVKGHEATISCIIRSVCTSLNPSTIGR